MQRATEDHAAAAIFGLDDWLWIETGEGARRLREPREELQEAVEQRASTTVKDALKSLEEAPTAGAGGAKRGGGRRKKGEGV